MKFCFATLGCKVNQFETQALAQLAQERGHAIVDSCADVCVLNTCTVTASGTKKNLRELKKLKKANPDAVLALCGCFAQTEPDRAAAIEGVSVVCGTSDRAHVIELCEQAVKKHLTANTVSSLSSVREFEALPAGILPGHTRALLKVQDGCDNYCTYCIIPYARGHVRSLPLNAAVEQVNQLNLQGVKEIIITGIEIAGYGRDLPEKPSLAELTYALCSAAPNIRFRLGSLEPRIITEEFCRSLSQCGNLAHHFHLSLQSGCDSTLKRMHRRYSTELYEQSVELLRRYFPICSITTDIITGFPGETEDEFAQTCAFVDKLRFASIHVFPYSERSGTVAASMPDSVPQHIRAERADLLRAKAKQLEQEFLRSFIGQTVRIILERPHNGAQLGHGPLHFAVRLDEVVGRQGEAVSVRILRIENGEPVGQII